MHRIVKTLACAALAAIPGRAQVAPVDEQPPHIVVFLADDLGWRDVGYHRSEIPTPHIDALASQGVRLEQFYVQPVCSQTRAAFMTGRYPMRYGLQVGVIAPWARYGLSLDERLLPEALQEAGYTTAICGKWHLGFHERAYLPTARGFDHQYGHYTGTIDYRQHTRAGAPDWNRDDRPLDEAGYSTRLIADECVRLIRAHDTFEPLFLYVPFNAPHTPLQAPAKYLAKCKKIRGEKRRKFAAMVMCMDDAIGDIVAALEHRGMREDTLIVFASDNGGQTQGGADNRPLRSRKGSLYEGGVRVPAFAVWPRHLPAHAVLDEPLHIVDLHATLLSVARARPPGPERPLDGRDSWDVLRLKAPMARREILLNASPRVSALRSGRWKLIERIGRNGTRYELYDLAEDPTEEHNVASRHRDRVAELKARLAAYQSEAVPPLGPAAEPDPLEPPERWRPEDAAGDTSEPAESRGQAAAPAVGPNVILCMADDLGYGDAGFRGHPVLKTPHLDAMAAGGVRFSRFYAAAPVCSPTRGSCLTGRHPSRYGIRGANDGHLPAGEANLAALLKGAGYATGHFGKWHLGTLTREVRDSNRGGIPKYRGHYAPPWERGFDVCFSTEAKVPTWNPMRDPRTGAPYGTAYWDERGERVTENLRGDDSRVIMDRAIPFVRDAARAGRPFFAVVWFHSPHRPVVAHPRARTAYADVEGERERAYYACISAMDEQIGRLRRTLRELGVAEDTMLWFCSDNGPAGGASAPGSTAGLRGRKGSLHEGGIRVPAVLEWPARVPEPRVVDVPCSTADYLPTICAALGLRASTGVEPIDGESLLDWIDGRGGERTRGIAFRHARQRALIGPRYKLISVDDGESYQLYDLVSDPRETNDLAASVPDVHGRMIDTLDVWLASCTASRGTGTRR